MSDQRNNLVNNLQEIYKLKLTQEEFKQLSNFISQEYGIKMPDIKITMLQSRLHKRLKALNVSSFKDYFDIVFSKNGRYSELINMIDVITTNKTDFFREPGHFSYLTQNILPDFIAQKGKYEKIKIWSAGCSSGEEPYTIAFTIHDFMLQNPFIDYSILGTDLSTVVLKKAVEAIYPEPKVAIMPLEMKKRYLLRSKSETNRTVRVVPEIRKKIRFQRLNLMDKGYSVDKDFDIIFCRNVLIYFNREVQEKVINKLAENLRTGGYFFLGHSESIMSMDVPLKQIRPTIFVKV